MEGGRDRRELKRIKRERQKGEGREGYGERSRKQVEFSRHKYKYIRTWTVCLCSWKMLTLTTALLKSGLTDCTAS